VLPDNTEIVVVEEGLVGEIKTAEGEEVEYLEEIQALKTENENLKAELQTAKEAMAVMETEHSEVVAVLDGLKAKKSTFVPPVAQANFRKTHSVEKSQADVLAERRQMLNQKKK